MTGKLHYILLGCSLLAVSSVALANKGDWKDKDTNDDGMVSRAEFMAAAEDKFKKMDDNNDGSITESEFKEDKSDKKSDKSQDSNRSNRY
jgi:hypothetical protein